MSSTNVFEAGFYSLFAMFAGIQESIGHSPVATFFLLPNFLTCGELFGAHMPVDILFRFWYNTTRRVYGGGVVNHPIVGTCAWVKDLWEC